MSHKEVCTIKSQTFTEVLEQNKIELTIERGQQFDIFKADDDKRLVFGWANIAFTADGEQLEDLQRDIIDTEDLEEAVYKYVLEFRDGGEEHIPTMRKKASLVESVMFTKEKMKAMGIPEGVVPEGWWIGFYVSDDSAWARIKDGTYKMFSIEGKAIRIPVEDENIDKADRINGCGVLVIKDGKILTGTRIGGKHGNQICGPGGHIESGETHEEAAIREAREEFGIECKALTSLGILDGGRNYGKSAVFLCTEYEGEPKTDEEEMTDCRWRTIEELQEERLFKPFEQSLELVTEEVPTAKSFMDVVQKFNPFHDSLGRFASSNSFASYSANPKTKAGQMAIQRSTAAGYGGVLNVHRESKGENIKQNDDWITSGKKPTASQLARAQSNAPKNVQQMRQNAHTNRVKGQMGATETSQAIHPSRAKKPAPQQNQNSQTSQQKAPQGLQASVANVTLTGSQQLGIQPRNRMGQTVTTRKVADANDQPHVKGKDISKNVDIANISGGGNAIDKVARAQGWNKGATVTDDFDTFQKAAVKSGQLMFRSVYEDSSNEVCKRTISDGNYSFNGTGMQAYGGGMYCVGAPTGGATGPTYGRQVHRSQNHSYAYGDNQMMATVHPSAKIAGPRQSKRMRNEFYNLTPAERSKFGGDYGAYIASKGFDGAKWHQGRTDPYITMYNKSAMIFYSGVASR